MRVRRAIADIHGSYSAQVGSDRIAGKSALEGLTRWLHRTKPRRILEAGPGIGTTSATIISAMAGETYEHVAIEDDAFCLDALRRNLGGQFDRLEIHPALSEGLGFFDFVLMDGPAHNERDILTGDAKARAEASRYFGKLSPGAVVFFEGSRHGQQQVFREVCERSWAYMRVRPHDEPKGGYHVYKLDPSPLERTWFMADQSGRWAASRASPVAKQVAHRLRLTRV